MPTPALTHEGLGRVLHLARERLTDGIAVEDLADHAGYSPFHFTRLFTGALGIGPGKYLTALRMDAAKRLLLASDDPVVEVATAVGFDSLSSFSRRFRADVGVPPAALRRLADRVADHPARPFRLVPAHPERIRVELAVPAPLLPAGDLSVWVGWYPHPAPIGLPAAGVLTEYGETLELPLCPGAPWLLGFAVPAAADPVAQLAPDRPLVAVAHVPGRPPLGVVRLPFRHGGPDGVPLLSALPSLCRRVG